MTFAFAKKQPRPRKPRTDKPLLKDKMALAFSSYRNGVGLTVKKNFFFEDKNKPLRLENGGGEYKTKKSDFVPVSIF